MNQDNINDILLYDETVFKDVTVFNPDYIPENFKLRDGQIREMTLSIRLLLQGGKAINNLILGPPATGKTTAVKKLFESVEYNYSNKIVCIHINSQLHSTKFDIFSQIYKKVFGHTPPETGVPFARIYNSIMNELSQKNMALIVALDDINHLFSKNVISEVFYDILRAYESYPNVKTAIFAILSDVEFRHVLDKNVGSIFNANEIHFSPYTYDEMSMILKERIKLGFYPTVISDELVDEIIDYTYSSGDLRLGIDLLCMSGNNAEIRASKTITDDDVTKAINSADSMSIEYVLENLSQQEASMLYFISSLKDKNITSGKLYEKYNRKNKISYATYNRIINKLEFLRLIDTTYTGLGQKGNSRYVALRFDKEIINKQLEDKINN